MPHTAAPLTTREAKLFRNNRSQAVRIPVEFELPGEKVLIHKEGDKLIIEPLRRHGLIEILAGLSPLGPEDQLPDDLDEGLIPLGDVAL
jgi:antitoxin VapB